MAFYHNLKEHFHQNQSSTPSPMVSLRYLLEKRSGIYGILEKSEGVFSSKLALQCVFLAKPQIFQGDVWLHYLMILFY